MTQMRKIVLLVDGIHAAGLVTELDRVVPLAEAELILVYVHGHSPRHGLELVRRRPGGAGMPPTREQGIDEAERQRGAAALAEAERAARSASSVVRTVDLHGGPGERVVELAARELADLIAVRATSGHLGPAARFICDHAPCPVVILRESG